MEYDPRRMCELLVGLGDVEVLSVVDEQAAPLRIDVRRGALRPPCSGCGGVLRSDGDRLVELAGPACVRPFCEAGVAQAPVALCAVRLRCGHDHRAGT